jgi:hypothetical protein
MSESRAIMEQARRQANNYRGPPHESSWHKPTLEVERILLVNFASTKAWAKGGPPSAYQEGARLRMRRPSP